MDAVIAGVVVVEEEEPRYSTFCESTPRSSSVGSMLPSMIPRVIESAMAASVSLSSTAGTTTLTVTCVCEERRRRLAGCTVMLNKEGLLTCSRFINTRRNAVILIWATVTP